ncbi:Caspase-7 [Pseudolycoriella hygida]|uniref:Caspase-7 n=1 Tax=Pseudolycoriella hygida TaxID=35572 RepID=A0A9Q0N6F9_9DIPT|nr:Caspase-7 [Pseudolycoriella hygida]
MVYMSHGKKHGVVSAADTKFILKDVIINPIMRNQTLRGIPKIFITVACRGDRYYARDGEENDGCFTSKLTDIDIDYSECIISYSTYKGFYSIRTGKGTYFIQHLCDNIDEDNGNSDIHSLFAKVNGELAEMKKQVPVFKSTMSKISLRDLATKY